MELDDARIAVLIPAYNEGRQIAGVLRALPSYVDDIVVVNDASADDTGKVVRACAQQDARIHLIDLPINRGVGGALAEAYRWALAEDVDVAVTVDGDGQMDPEEMADLIAPILAGDADYTKGNRLTAPASWRSIPRVRLLGNSILSLLTKIVSGYWMIADSQSGYTAASRYALQNIDWDRIYPRYGRPNDVLVHANIADCRVADVPIRPLYGIGERSSMKMIRVICTIALLLARRFWWRLGVKYVLRDFHPLVFFYLFATMTGIASALLAVRFFALWIKNGYVPQLTALALAFFLITTLNSTFFAFWMDKEANAALSVRARNVHPTVGRRGDAPSLTEVVRSPARADEAQRAASRQA